MNWLRRVTSPPDDFMPAENTRAGSSQKPPPSLALLIGVQPASEVERHRARALGNRPIVERAVADDRAALILPLPDGQVV
jgi:hypothetical protein